MPPQNKKGQFIVRIWRPAPGTLVDTPPICPFCVDPMQAQAINPHTINETISLMKAPPTLRLHVCERHFTSLGPKAVEKENIRMMLSIIAIEVGVPLVTLPFFYHGPDSFPAFPYMVTLLIANVLFFVFGLKRILKGVFEKQEKLYLSSWRWKRVIIYAKNGPWLADFAQMHPELLVPVHEIPRKN